MPVRFAKKFSKQYDKADKRIQTSFDERLRLFLADPFNPRLNNHTLAGKFLGYRSINITGDWRAIYSEKDGVIIFELLGTHNQLYR